MRSCLNFRADIGVEEYLTLAQHYVYYYLSGRAGKSYGLGELS